MNALLQRREMAVVCFLLAVAGCDGCEKEGAPTGDLGGDRAPLDAGVIADAGDFNDPDSGVAPSADAGIEDPPADAGPEPEGDCAATAGFCWLHPRGFGVDLDAVSGTSADDVWAVGIGGVIVHSGATGWTQLVSPTTEDLLDVHAAGPDDVWAVGRNATVLHFDGTAWTTVPGIVDDHLFAVFALGPDEVWIGGMHSIYRFDGQSLSISPTPFPTDVEARSLFAFGSDEVWVGTAYGTMLHFDGERWANDDADFELSHGISDLWGSGPNDLWAVAGFGAEIAHRQDGTWSRLPYVSGSTPETIAAVHGSAADDVWFVGDRGLWHYDGESFTRFDAPVAPFASTLPTGIWSMEGLTYVVGPAGHVFRFADGSWSLESGSFEGIYQRWFSLVAAAPDDVWVFGLGTSMQFNGEAFVATPTVETTWRQDFTSAWAAGPDDIWVVGVGQWGDNLQHYDGNSFSRVDTGSFNSSDWLNDVWGSGPEDIYFVSMGTPFHWDGVAFTEVDIPASCDAVHGTGPADVWMACGTGGSSSGAFNGLWHFDGSEWTQESHDDVWWSSVHAIAPNDAWAGGGGGTIKHWDGNEWTIVPVDGMPLTDPGNEPFVSAFAGTDPNEVWAVANDKILHWNGTWSMLPSFGVRLNDIEVAADGSVYVTGSRDSVLRKR